MPLLDFLKRKKKKRKKEKEKEKPQKKKRKDEKPTPKKKKKVKKTKQGSPAYRVLRRPHISEKATELAENNQYVFEVFPDANKPEIKRVIEDVYGVDVIKVNLIKIPPKPRNKGRIEGSKKGFKKAVVKIKEGQNIEIL